MIHDRVKHVTFSSLTEICSANKRTCLLSYDKLIKAPYYTSLKPEIARMVFRASVGIKENFKKKYDGKLSCPFCRQSPGPEIARMVFRARVGIYDIKEYFKKKYDGKLCCPFCRHLPSSLSTYSSATQGFFVRSS